MALPVTISSILTTGGFAGPFKASTGDYFFACRLTATPAVLRIYRATSPDVAWASIVASVTIPNVSTATTAGHHGTDAVQDGDILHIATVDADVTTTTSTRIYYHKLDMSSGASSTFTLSNELVDGPTATSATTGGDFRSIAIVRRSASVVIAYQMPFVLYMSANYSRVGYRERTDAAGTWGAAVALDAIGAAATSAIHTGAIKDPQTDRIHFHWMEGTASPYNLRVRTLSAANAFNTASTLSIAQAPPGVSNIGTVRGAAYVSGGVSKVVITRPITASTTISGVYFNSADNPTVSTSSGTAPAAPINTGMSRNFADNEIAYYCYVDNTSTDLFVATSTNHGATWSTFTNAFAGTFGTAMSSNGGICYQRGWNYVIPYVISDGGTIKYNEYIVRSPPGTADAWNGGDATLVTLSNSDKTATTGGLGGVRSTTTLANGTAGKYYAEIVLAGTAVPTAVGIMATSASLTTNADAFGMNSVGQIIVNAALSGIDLGTPAVGDVVSVAWDAGAERVWFRLNAGDWNLSATANPATGAEGVDVSFAAATLHGLWMRAATTGPAATIRTEAAEFTQAVPSTGFTSWMGEALVGGPVDINVTGSQTLSAVTQSSDVTVPRNVDANQTTLEAATAGTIQAQEARAVTGAQATEATTQTATAALLAKVTTGTQGTNATTQTSAVTAGLVVTAAQTLSPVTQSTAVKVGLAVTGAQNTNAATTVADAKAIATGTAAQTLAATTQTSGITLGPASFAVTGNQTLSATTQVLTASLGTAFVTVTGAQNTLEATTSATAKALASVTGAQNTFAVTQSLTADADLAVTGSQTLSPVTTAATAKLLAAVTGAQTLSAPTSAATAGVAATVTTGTQTTNAAVTAGTITAPPALSVTGAQTLSATTQVFSLSLGAPFLTVTGAQDTGAATTSATATAALKVTTGAQTLSPVATVATADVDTQVTGAQTLQGAATAGSIALVPFGAVVVNGAQTLSEATTTGSILLGALPTRIVDGAQSTLACTTTGTIDGGGVPVEPPIELPSGGGGSRAYRRRLRESLQRRARFEDARARRIAAIGREDERKRDPLTMEPPPLIPAPETMEMLNRLLYEPITREIEQPNPPAYEDDGGEEELLLLLSAA